MHKLSTYKRKNSTFIRPSQLLKAPPHRQFTASIAFQGKGKKQKASGETSSREDGSSPRDSTGSTANPHDFAALEDDIAGNLRSLQSRLAQLRTSTRLDPKRVEDVRIVLDKAGSQSVKLGDVAQVIPKGGRNMVVLVGDKDVCLCFFTHEMNHFADSVCLS